MFQDLLVAWGKVGKWPFQYEYDLPSVPSILAKEALSQIYMSAQPSLATQGNEDESIHILVVSHGGFFETVTEPFRVQPYGSARGMG